MPPLEAWEKVFLGDEGFLATFHAKFGCIACHGGSAGTDDMDAAHEGVVADPDPEQACALCHAEITEAHVNSLHYDLQGYLTVLTERSDEEHMPQLMEAYNTQCTGCHATCGQCHVSRPAVNGGGLIKGHAFKEIPPMNLTCTGCHGSRINDEFKGKNEMEGGGHYPADVHYNPGGMACFECHTADEMHGTQGDFDHRYDGPQSPSCTDAGCHDDVAPGDGIEQHDQVHLDRLSCQVCHSVAYKSCYNCHVQESDEGTPFFKIDPSQMLFKIGRNPIRSTERPWEYVVLRHVPVARDTFSFYDDNLLPNFDSRSTWVYATPHNIQRVTPQNSSCDACHDNPDVFLTEGDVPADEMDANQDVIVYRVPSAP